MRYSENILRALKNMIAFNFEIEKIYLEAFDAVQDENLKIFFKERGYERHEFGRRLMLETQTISDDTALNFDGRPDIDLYRIWMNFRRLYLSDDTNGLLEEICKIKQMTIDKYNSLQRLELPLSTFRLLEVQKENIKETLNAIKTENAFVA